MMRPFSVVRLIVVLGVITALSAGCSRDPNVRKQKFFKSGQEYFEQGKYREAALQFENATQVDPRFAEAHYSLAQTFLRLQQWAPAYQELSRAVDLQPENYAAHLDITNLLIAGRDYKQAQEHVDILLDKQPNDPKVHNLAATLLASQGDFRGAMPEAQKAIELDPKQSDPYLTLSLIQLRLNQPELGEQNLKKAVELSPTSTTARLALASFYQSRGRATDAEQQLRSAIAASPKTPELRAALVKLLVSQGKKTEAEQFLQQTKQDLADNSAGYRMLGDYYFATGDIDRAITEYTSLNHDHPDDVQVKKNYIQLLILNNRLDEAAKLNDEILKGSPNDPEALIYRGQILIRQNKPDEAVTALQNAIKSDSKSGVAHYHLGVAFDQQGNQVRAESEWQEAVRLRPDLPEAHRAIAALYLRKGDMAALEQSASQIIALQPNSPEGYLFRALSYINRRQFPNAEKDIRKVIEIAPQSPAGYVQMGNLNFVQKNFNEAAKWYQQALDHEPGSADALGGLMNNYLAQKQPDKAIAAVNTQIAKVPNSSAFYDLLGTVLFNHKKDPAAAETALRKSLELDKNNADALGKLAQALIARGSPDEAIARYQQAVQQNPREPSSYILLGELYESKQDWNNAKQMYQKANDLRPNNPLASNNLAYLLVQTGGSLDTALTLAQNARRAMPESPNVADTLGWVYYQKGVYRSAIDLFEESLKLAEKHNQGENATVHYHLGLAYDKAGEAALAKRHLQRALQINPQHPDAADMKKILAQLG
jgi:tetratricopeptide (TPR) repeat protein